MEAAGIVAVFTSSLAALLIAIVLPLFLSGERWKAAQDKGRARRIAEARMQARLLRLNI